ncbi:MAG: Cu-processing system ATP-binding protein [Saprospiraceae bacterium]|jgi:Cu-processing system ATP-binding protein
MIKIEKLYKKFGQNEVLKGIDVDFDRPGITAVLGPNGSGKTTLIKSVLGMVIPDKGSIELDGKPIIGEYLYRNQIDYLPQIARFPENLTVKELLRMIKDLRGQEANDKELIAYFDLAPFLDKRLGNLSGGTRQKVNIIQAFMYDSPIMMLDEPTAGLDPVAMIRLKDLIFKEKAKGKIILITTHIMSFVEEMSDELIFLLEGKIHFKGTVKQLKYQYDESNLERAIARILQGEEPIITNGKVIKLTDVKLNKQ